MKYNLAIANKMAVGGFSLCPKRSRAKYERADDVVFLCEEIQSDGNIQGLVFVKDGITAIADGESVIRDRKKYLELDSRNCTVFSPVGAVPNIGCFAKIQFRLPETFSIIVSSREIAINISAAFPKIGLHEQPIKVSVVDLKFKKGGKIYQTNIDSIENLGRFGERLKSCSGYY